MKHKRTVRIKKENLSLEWDGLVLRNGKGTIDLGRLTCISQPLIGQIREFLSLRHNNTWNDMKGTYYNLGYFNTWLSKRTLTIANYSDLDQTIFTVFLAHCRLGEPTDQTAFYTLRKLYEFGGDLLRDGVLQDTLAMIRKVKFKSPDHAKYIKTMDTEKGPLLRCELEALRQRLREWLLPWKDMNIVEKVVALAYALNDETTRRFEELCNLNADDIYKTSEGVFVRIGPRKTKSKGSDSHKVGHAISDWLFPFFEEYKKETDEIRKSLSTERLFVWENQHGKLVVNGGLITKTIQRILEEHPVPNRRFFASQDHDIAELQTNKDLCLHFTSSRIRDTFGTHMTLLGVDRGQKAARMGHTSMQSQKRYDVVTHPDFASEALSMSLGGFYKEQSDYFMNAPVAIIPPAEAVRDLGDPDGAVFGGCKTHCASNPVLSCYSCPRYIPLVPSPEHARNLLKIEAEEKSHEQLILNAGGTVDTRLKSDFEKAKAICARCAELSKET